LTTNSEIAARRHAELTAERTATQAAGGEYAESLGFEIRWNAGAPTPLVFSSGSRAFVLFYRDVPRAAREEGRFVPAVGAVEFLWVRSIKFGGPNDETLSGHPLFGKGLEYYAAHEVKNSRWIEEEEKINSVHPRHRGGWRDSLRHYILTFHDETLECLAREIRTEQLDCNYPEAVAQIAARLVNDG
jgi:hypothetical protein